VMARDSTLRSPLRTPCASLPTSAEGAGGGMI
jgi:hypothetical protein